MSEMVLNEGAIFNLVVNRYADFAFPLSDLEFDVDSYDYYAQIVNRRTNEVIGSFNITTGIDLILLILRREQLELIPDGNYSYDLKRVSKDSLTWETIILRGDINITSGATRLP